MNVVGIGIKQGFLPSLYKTPKWSTKVVIKIVLCLDIIT